jgi:hypothetical protein
MAGEGSDFRIPLGGIAPTERWQRVERDTPTGDAPRRDRNPEHPPSHHPPPEEPLPQDEVVLSETYAAPVAAISPLVSSLPTVNASPALPAERHLDIHV